MPPPPPISDHHHYLLRYDPLLTITSSPLFPCPPPLSGHHRCLLLYDPLLTITPPASIHAPPPLYQTTIITSYDIPPSYNHLFPLYSLPPYSLSGQHRCLLLYDPLLTITSSPFFLPPYSLSGHHRCLLEPTNQSLILHDILVKMGVASPIHPAVAAAGLSQEDDPYPLLSPYKGT